MDDIDQTDANPAGASADQSELDIDLGGRHAQNHAGPVAGKGEPEPATRRKPREIDALTARVEGLDSQTRGLLLALRAIAMIVLALMILATILWLRRRGTLPVGPSTVLKTP